MTELSHLAVTRVRHTLKTRLLQVKRVSHVTPKLVRVTFGGEALHDFESASFDDHLKVFFPPEGAAPFALPHAGPDGLVFDDSQPRPAMRDFTPRRYDQAACELDLEFALHDAGPATRWAAQATVGQYLGIGGPRGSMIIPTEFDWHWLIGDETALPAIARRLEELPASAQVYTVIEIADPSCQVSFTTQARLHATWLPRNAADAASPLVAALRQLPQPSGEGYVWAAGEAAAMRAVRQYLRDERGIDKSRIRAAAYWRRGAEGVHEVLDE
ncbi:siderophore-interacting protein [Paraburkholderia bonniea]|uniref:siderophore-interacting protein n=1 Tax=Paraburkholderia bonniea TaxID=2152891 RepID=UPI00129171BF|nr:siderophore-interacting protein [Paraburkholderia bonniea]WJF90262.1 siderophore-interacting protein [Paraburkholderia bonniea]WJF93577.1 siderophore-interacting protein [Paraburkholderia bonniea]